MRKSKKLFGLFNSIDIIIILLLVVAAVLGWKFFFSDSSRGQGAQNTKTYTYVVEGQEVLDEMASFPVVGTNARNSSTSDYLGIIEQVETEPYTEIILNTATDEFRKVPVDGYQTIRLTISGTGTETESDITVEGTTVKVGMELNVKGKGFAFKGIVVDVRDGE